MNYKNVYESIIRKRKQEIPKGYTEKHHIIPRSLGGNNEKNNIVKLTAREHFICHLLLTKIYPEGSIQNLKMCKAFICMIFRKSKNQKRYFNSHWYKYYRERFSKIQSKNQMGENNCNYGTCWIINLQTGDIKRIKKSELETYLQKGYVRGRTLNDRYRMSNGRYIRLSAEQKKINKQISLQKLKHTRQLKGPQICYINKLTGIRKYFSKQEKPDLNVWEPTWSKFNVEHIKNCLLENKTWKEIAQYYNTTYWSIYSWYRDNKHLF